MLYTLTPIPWIHPTKSILVIANLLRQPKKRGRATVEPCRVAEVSEFVQPIRFKVRDDLYQDEMYTKQVSPWFSFGGNVA